MAIEESILRRLPRPLRRPLRRLVYLPTDLVERLLGRRSGLLPPRGCRYVGAGEFTAVGEEFAGYLVEHCGLRPDSRVLDVGCGIGRIALPLTRQLSAAGSYDGFDVVRSAVAWCRRHLGRRFPNFHFHHVDVYNGEYNRRGRIAAVDFRFPFPDGAFDVVVATSLFTHLLPSALERYIAEAARVLAPGGSLLATFFLIDDEVRRQLADGACPLGFTPFEGPAFVLDRDHPEAGVAYDEAAVRDLLDRTGVAVAEPVRQGGWCGRERFTSYQDLVVARRIST